MPDRSVLPGLLTLAGALCALWASILLIRDGSAATEAAVLWWWLAVICDQLDGPLARALGATSPRGALLDGLSDSVLYLLAPAAICLVSDAPLAGLAAFKAFGDESGAETYTFELVDMGCAIDTEGAGPMRTEAEGRSAFG